MILFANYKNLVFSHRPLYVHCTSTVRPLYVHCTSTVRPLHAQRGLCATTAERPWRVQDVPAARGAKKIDAKFGFKKTLEMISLSRLMEKSCTTWIKTEQWAMDRDVPLGPPASMLSIAPLVQDFFHSTPPVARPQNDNNIKYGSTRADTRELQSGAGFFPPTVPKWAFSLTTYSRLRSTRVSWGPGKRTANNDHDPHPALRRAYHHDKDHAHHDHDHYVWSSWSS